MNTAEALRHAARLSSHASSAVSCLVPSTAAETTAANPYAALGYLLDARTLVTHALDALTEALAEANEGDRIDAIYRAHGQT